MFSSLEDQAQSHRLSDMKQKWDLNFLSIHSAYFPPRRKNIHTPAQKMHIVVKHSHTFIKMHIKKYIKIRIINLHCM